MTPHPYAEILRAIADGKQIQRLVGIDEWYDVSHNDALHYVREATAQLRHTDLRIKPEPRTAWYRVAEMRSWSGDYTYTCTMDKTEQKTLGPDFIRWLTDWIEYEVSE